MIAVWLALALAVAPTVKVQVDSHVMDLPLERYVAGVLAGESSVFHSDAALQAMAVAARTYAVRQRGRHADEGYDFCSTTHCQRVDLEGITPRLERLAAATAGELLWFEGKPAFTPYTRDCGGQSEADPAAPYLKSRADPYCLRAGAQKWQWAGDPAKIANALLASGLRAPRPLDSIVVAGRTASGRALDLALTGAGESVRVSAGSLRFAVGRALGWNTVRSDLYEIQSGGGRIIFQGRGAGHGVGLCQRGADQMGIEGRTYREILAFYYPGTAVGASARGLAWQRLSGEGLVLWTTQPEHDREVLDMAAREARAAAQRVNWPMPANVEIRVYPDMDSYRNSTGEPGTVAAYTEGRRIHMQPVDVLRSREILAGTIRHELFHVLVESRAVPGLPVWFREGLVEYLAGQKTSMDLLVKRYGEATVLGWVVRGLPPEVMNSSASQAATKSR
ncbi:MAG: SpoIID/LytB domain-containing protein [Bryobacteraceae bacterium]